MQQNIIIARQNVTVIISSIAANQCFVVTFTGGKEFHGIINSIDKNFVTQECVKAGYPNEFLFGHTDHRNKNGLCHAYIVPENSGNGIYIEEVEDSTGIHLEISPFKDRDFSPKKNKEMEYPEM